MTGVGEKRYGKRSIGLESEWPNPIPVIAI
jgi:hypothetical protein